MTHTISRDRTRGTAVHLYIFKTHFIDADIIDISRVVSFIYHDGQTWKRTFLFRDEFISKFIEHLCDNYQIKTKAVNKALTAMAPKLHCLKGSEDERKNFVILASKKSEALLKYAIIIGEDKNLVWPESEEKKGIKKIQSIIQAQLGVFGSRAFNAALERFLVFRNAGAHHDHSQVDALPKHNRKRAALDDLGRPVSDVPMPDNYNMLKDEIFDSFCKLLKEFDVEINKLELLPGGTNLMS